MLMMAKMGGMLGGGGGGPTLQLLPYTSSGTSSGLTGADGDGSGMRDGVITSGASCWGSSTSINAWLKMDLGSVRLIDRVVLRPIGSGAAAGWSHTHTNNCSIQTSNDNSSWAERAITGTDFTGDSSVMTYMIGVSARYIRAAKASSYLGLGDFQVFAS